MHALILLNVLPAPAIVHRRLSGQDPSASVSIKYLYHCYSHFVIMSIIHGDLIRDYCAVGRFPRIYDTREMY